MTLAVRVLIGLLCGFLLGLSIAGSSSSAALTILAILAPVGTIFVNLIRLVVVPLVMSLVMASVGSMTSAGGFGRTATRGVLIALALLASAAAGTAVVAQPVLARISIDQAAALALRGA